MDRASEEPSKLGANAAQRDEIVQALGHHPVPADREARSSDERRQQRVQARTVRKAHVDRRGRVVDPPPGATDDPGEKRPHLLVRPEARADLLLGAARANDEAAAGRVDDDLLDLLVVEERLERTETEEPV